MAGVQSGRDRVARRGECWLERMAARAATEAKLRGWFSGLSGPMRRLQGEMRSGRLSFSAFHARLTTLLAAHGPFLQRAGQRLMADQLAVMRQTDRRVAPLVTAHYGLYAVRHVKLVRLVPTQGWQARVKAAPARARRVTYQRALFEDLRANRQYWTAHRLPVVGPGAGRTPWTPAVPLV